MMTGAEMAATALEGSVLIVAHPDDEVLWFGSVAARVDHIVVCFLNDPGKPELGLAREKALEAHPWRDRISCLGLDETGAFGLAGWPRPEVTDFGLRLVAPRKIAAEYQKRYQQLCDALTPYVRNATNIFTHNPWGEYGHEEHILVHRAATAVAEANGKSVWYDNYASNWSEDLMRWYLDRAEHQVFQGNVAVEQMDNVANTYRAQGAWTWFDSYVWFSEEFFVRGPLSKNDRPDFGWLFPMNMLRLPERDAPQVPRRKSIIRRTLRKIIGK
jgi:LmbE family N-acetylglucosaminyl deacetylase